MPAPAKCPGCGTRLLPDWESCPNCPLSFGDGPPEKGAFQNENFRNYGLPMLFFGGLAFLLWQFSQFMWTTAEKNSESYDTRKKVAEAVVDPKLQRAKVGAGVVPVDSKAIQGLVNEQVTGVYDPDGDAPPEERKPAVPEETGPGIVSITPTPGKNRRVVREWKLRGRIYDLVTLKPIPDVHMIFTDNATNSKAQIVTDHQGFYKVVLPPLTEPARGYLVELSKGGYEKAYLNPGTDGVSEKPVEERKQMARELATLILEPYPVHPASEDPLVTDFHMAPKNP